MFQDSQLVGGGKEERGSLGGLDPVSWDGDANERPGGEAAQLEELVKRERNAGRCRKARVEWDSSRVETETRRIPHHGTSLRDLEESDLVGLQLNCISVGGDRSRCSEDLRPPARRLLRGLASICTFISSWHQGSPSDIFIVGVLLLSTSGAIRISFSPTTANVAVSSAASTLARRYTSWQTTHCLPALVLHPAARATAITADPSVVTIR
ncbi:MAG: hypothetical protein L6R36_000262 [Xanthoria steineri]|nr:MAG: hypothetical protein L6R36_000262 [Xanthoria steineri]